MTNEEAFKSWFDDQIWGNESWEDGLREAWQAAIAYMQEQNKSAEQSEPFAYTDGLGSLYFDGNSDWDIPLYTAPQRQQPLKRLSEDKMDDIFNSYSDEQGYVAIDDWHLLTNAIMDEMERINK